jgi:hypothetical protein
MESFKGLNKFPVIAVIERWFFVSRSQAVLGNALYYRQVKLCTHFRSQVQLGNESIKSEYLG